MWLNRWRTVGTGSFGRTLGLALEFGAVAELRAGTRTQRWEGDRLRFSVAAMGQAVSGSVDVLETAVEMEIELPGLLGQIAGAFKRGLQKAGQLLLSKD